MTATELVGRNRKLNQTQKLKLARLAYERFIDPKARAAEDKAQAALVAAVTKASKALTPVDWKSLRKVGMVAEVDKIGLAYHILIETGTNSFQVGDKTVERPKSEGFYRPYERANPTPSTIYEAVAGKTNNDKYIDTIDIGQKLQWPATYANCGELKFDSTSGVIRIKGSNYMPDYVLAALKKFYLAAHGRRQAELTLGKTASKLINASTHFDQILEFWPEAKEIEAELFEARLPKAMSLVTISDEDKAALCVNMKTRGVKGSDLCQAA